MTEWVDSAKQHGELMARQVRYGQDIAAWLRRNFPELCDPSPHPAAIAAVIRLHYTEGKGSLTRRAHGPLIRAAVQRFEAQANEERRVP